MALSTTIGNLISDLPAASRAAIVPAPKYMAQKSGRFELNADTVIVAAPDSLCQARMLANRLAKATGYFFDVRGNADRATSRIELRLDESAMSLGAEGYELLVSTHVVTIVAPAKAGLFYGTQTLLQLFPPAIFSATSRSEEDWSAPCVEIRDAPRFSWRGAMLDVSRHFMPAEFLYTFIDALALHKINVLQLHLSDDQGWRIEIKKYPKLTQIGAVRKHTMVGLAKRNPWHAEFDAASIIYDDTVHAGFYTQDEMRAVVEYAAARNITIVPEIEMPGHAQSAVAAYPELGCTGDILEASPLWGIHDVLYNPSEATISFLKDVLTEVMEVFPSPFIHIGGDEAVKNQWRKSAECQARIAELGLRDESHLQAYLIGRIDEFLTANGRRLIGWDEILEGGLAPGAVVMSWRGEKGGITAAGEGHDVVMAPYQYTYLDYYQTDDHASEPLAFPSTVTLEQIYTYSPIPKELPENQHGHVLGAQGQLWTEYMPNSKQVEYMAFPRLCALAEVTWSDPDAIDYDAFLSRLDTHLERLDALGVRYRAPHPETDAPGQSKPNEPCHGA